MKTARLLLFLCFSGKLAYGYPYFCSSHRFSVNSRCLSQFRTHTSFLGCYTQKGDHTCQHRTILLFFGHFLICITATSQIQRGSIRVWLLSQQTPHSLMFPPGERFLA